MADDAIPKGTARVRQHLDGFPKVISFMKPIDKNDYSRIRFVLTLLSILRGIEGLEEEDISPITDEMSVSKEVALKAISNKTIKSFCYKFARHQGVPQWGGKFHFSTKMGPNGHAMSATAIDAVSLSTDDIKNISVVGGNELRSRLEMYISYVSDQTRRVGRALCIRSEAIIPYKGIVAKIVSIPRPEGKTRVIAQLDYWTQESLMPVHKFIMNRLRRIPNDLTFRQGSARSVISRFDGNKF